MELKEYIEIQMAELKEYLDGQPERPMDLYTCGCIDGEWQTLKLILDIIDEEENLYAKNNQKGFC